MIPPAESTGSATTAQSEPTDCWSTSSNPASRHVQSHAPSQWRTGQRYAYGAGSANDPGSSGPNPACAIEKLTDAIPERSPWKERVRPTTSHRPLTILASLSATSFASEPVFRSITRSSPGTSPASRSPSASTGSASIHEFRCETVSRLARIASPMRGWLCPSVEQIWPDVKSRIRRPSVVSTQAPSARATVKGANPPA